MGEVYRARDPELSRDIALKFLSASAVGSAGNLDRFIREARAASALNHPGIVTVHDVTSSGDGLAIVMELVNGRALRELCGKPHPVEDVARWGAQAARALAAAHEIGIVHRDIKPENLMLRPDGFIKILDFGLARRLTSESAASTVGLPLGTLRYMSPEQIRAQSLTPATDIFSLGLVLYELATGVHPFDADSALVTSHRIASDAPRRPSGVIRSLPAAVDRLLLAMLAKDPSQRPSALETAARLEELRTPPPDRSVSRLRWGWVAVPAAALLIAAVALRPRDPLPPAPAAAPIPANLTSFTSLPGDEIDPCFSPDGLRVVYGWNGGGDSESHDIYTRALGLSDPVRLTSHPAEEFSPAWSPDGSRIAFLRSDGAGVHVVVMSASGAGQRVVTTGAGQSARKKRLAWAADGQAVIFGDDAPGPGDALRLYRVSIATGERSRLFSDSQGAEDLSPVLSHDRRHLAFIRLEEGRRDLWVARADGGQPRRLLESALNVYSVAWSRSGNGVFYVHAKTPNLIHFIGLDGAPGAVLQVAGSIHHLAASPASDLFCYQRRLSDSNIWRYSPSIRGFERLVNSTDADDEPRYSPTGSRIAFSSSRGGSNSVWISDRDGAGQRPVTNLAGYSGSPSWSPAEDWVAFDNNPGDKTSVLAIRLSDGAVRTLDTGYMPMFSATGESVYFTTKRSGRNEIWQAPLSGGPSRQITHEGGLEARESPDGKWLYYSKPADPNLYRRLLEGGPEEQLRSVHPFERYWDVAAAGVYFINAGALHIYDPATKRTRELARLPKRPIPGPRGLSAAPDGSVVFVQFDTYRSEIVVAGR
jgi:Tol biopolymer transport system component